MSLNARALAVVAELQAQPDDFRVQVSQAPGGGDLIDCGVAAPGGLDAGLALARVCLADRATVSLVPGPFGPTVQVATDDPLRACLAAQYAGWELAAGTFRALGSGPMRAAAGREELLRHLALTESAEAVVGVLETRTPPSTEIIQLIAVACQVPPDRVTLLFAPTASLAGTLQVVARAVETALHKLHLLGFDVRLITSALGWAPLPPPARSDLVAMGHTNDAIRYGGQVVLWTSADPAALRNVGPRVPASAAAGHERSFLELFEESGRDFYRMDPLLFGPAAVTLHSVSRGSSECWGQLAPELLARSWGTPLPGMAPGMS
ncbi:MAG TPA: methenyltetrahydromethanopterin cyclohydrolase [Gemmatales bacterium]|nr:methenyltetrahydromethanopterin cyclohydrolase [Gemmatales bacterium]HMP59944.1 methenyltetrahydromethanopterin cyclohydrolase [Gemmatales bacterium]